jgi:hypothetical protein
MSKSPADRFPVSLVMQREYARHRQWTYPRWTALGIVAGRRGEVEERGLHCRRIRHTPEGVEQFVWSGLALELYRDAAESYWHNLVGRQPSLFVACRADLDGAMRPCMVSADYDEAGAYMEADDSVFAVPIPPEVYRWLEAFVLQHYRPAPPHKRRRKAWSGGEHHVSS